MTGPLIWRGEVFIDASDVAAEAGCTRRNVQLHLKAHGTLDRLGRGNARDMRPEMNPKATPVSVAGRDFPSIRALARFTHRRLDTIRGWLIKGETGKLEQAVRQQERQAAAEGQA